MKPILFVILFSLSSFAETQSLEGVEYNCLNKAEAAAAKFKNHSLVSACRSRENTNKEYYTYCDGSGCSGFTMTFNKSACVLSERWNGQDDQDIIDPKEHEQSCLVASDFSKWVNAPKTNLNTMKIGDRTEIPASSVFQFVRDASNADAIEKAEAVGKQIRREYYQKNYEVDRVIYREISINEALKLLATSDGEFKALTKKELEKIESWIENHSITTVVQMNLVTNYMSGTGIEDNFIFLSIETYEPILVVNRFTYAE